MDFKIFYSWQSDLANPTNRGLIGFALEDAAKSLRTIEVEPVLDRDTRGVPGSPDIANIRSLSVMFRLLIRIVNIVLLQIPKS